MHVIMSTQQIMFLTFQVALVINHQHLCAYTIAIRLFLLKRMGWDHGLFQQRHYLFVNLQTRRYILGACMYNHTNQVPFISGKCMICT